MFEFLAFDKFLAITNFQTFLALYSSAMVVFNYRLDCKYCMYMCLLMICYNGSIYSSPCKLQMIKVLAKWKMHVLHKLIIYLLKNDIDTKCSTWLNAVSGALSNDIITI